MMKVDLLVLPFFDRSSTEDEKSKPELFNAFHGQGDSKLVLSHLENLSR